MIRTFTHFTILVMILVFTSLGFSADDPAHLQGGIGGTGNSSDMVACTGNILPSTSNHCPTQCGMCYGSAYPRSLYSPSGSPGDSGKSEPGQSGM